MPDTGISFGDDDEIGWETVNNPGPRAIGASLVLLYRDPTKSYKSIVIYDGGFTKRAFSSMTQPLKGWYQASGPANPAAKMTMIVGDGRPFLSEKVLFNGQLLATNPFISANGAKWDNTLFNLTGKLPPGSDQGTVKVEPHTLLSDCVSFSAIVLSTTVQDSDDDGLIDRLEDSVSQISDPAGHPLPNFHAMGAHSNHKDLFVEVGAMFANAGTTYGARRPGTLLQSMR